MVVYVRNFQNAIVFSEALLKLHSLFLLNLLGAGNYNVNIVCMSTAGIQTLNRRYRAINTPTDVLSFPYHENLEPGQLPQLKQHWDRNLGDLILGMAVIQEDCGYDGIHLKDRLPVVLAHGLCHLIGYRHCDLHNTKLMYSKEKSILQQFNATFGTNLFPLTNILL